jgi:hypothetical protein
MLANKGWSGILYRLRFDPTAPPVGVALFGDSGVQDVDLLREEAFGEDHYNVLWRMYGVRVLSRPALEDLLIAE